MHFVLLSDNPFGYGPPSQRQKQAQKYQVLRANEAVYEHRVGQLTAQYEDRLATRERNTVKKQQTRNQIDRLVEDLISESMANGEFDNLKGRLYEFCLFSFEFFTQLNTKFHMK